MLLTASLVVAADRDRALMAYEDREDIVATVEETYALMGRALSIDIPYAVVENAVRREVLERLMGAEIDPYVTDSEMLELTRIPYLELVDNVLRVHEQFLSPSGEEYDSELDRRGLTGSGRAPKVRGFRNGPGRVLDHVPGTRWIKGAFKWGNIILGSLGGVPGVGVVAGPIRELKESIEAQGDEDEAGPLPALVSWSAPATSLQWTVLRSMRPVRPSWAAGTKSVRR
jgi:hypothetical protein